MTIADDPILLPDPEPAQVRYTIISVDDHLVEPPGHVRGPAARRALQDRAPKVITDERGHEVWEFEGQTFTQVGMNAVAGRHEEHEEPRADQVQRHAPGLLGHRRAHPRHGPQRRLGLGELPVDDHRLLRPGVRAGPGPGARAGPPPRPGTTGSTTSGGRRIPSGSSRSASPTSPTPRRARPRSAATPPVASPRSPCPSGPTASACPRCSAATGTRSSRPARTPTPSSPCTSVPRAATRAPRARRRCSSAPPCSASSRWPPAPSGCGRATR